MARLYGEAESSVGSETAAFAAAPSASLCLCVLSRFFFFCHVGAAFLGGTLPRGSWEKTVSWLSDTLTAAGQVFIKMKMKPRYLFVLKKKFEGTERC